MKNLIKGMFLASVVTLIFACKNDPSANSASVANAAAPAATTAASTEAQSLAAPAATPTATAPTAATPAPVSPSASQVSPAPANPVNQSGGKTTTMKFDEMSYEWGKIKEGEKMEHIFKFKNTGNNDLIISDARGSCGCTVPEWPKEPIKAGKNGEIKVIFDSAHKNGPQSKTVTITANTEPSSIVLMIKGNVDPKEESK